MTDLTTLSIADAGRLMASGEITSTALTEAFLARIATVDQKIASYITVTGDLARAAARQADMERAGGLSRGPQHWLGHRLGQRPREVCCLGVWEFRIWVHVGNTIGNAC